MEDVKFLRSHSNSPLPEAGNDPGDPVRPEIDEENSTPNPPISAPYQDMEVTEPDEKDMLPDQDDIEEAGLSDNESLLSDIDEDLIQDFDAGEIAVEERPAQIIDETNINQIGVHKRKRAEGESDAPKKKKKKADKPRRKKRDEDAGADADQELGSRKSKRTRKEGGGRTRGTSPDDANLTPQERRKRNLDKEIDAALRGGSRRTKKKDGIELEKQYDEEIETMRRRMAAAAEADNDGRGRGEPARHKLKLLPEVVSLLNKAAFRDAIVDPETNLLEAVRFFLEPLSDGSLPAYDIQKELFAALSRLPINKDSLVASGIGKVIMFYIKSKRPETAIKRQAERLFTDWTRPILRRTDDYRKKEFVQADFDPSNLPARPQKAPGSQQAAARAKALEAPRAFQRARMEQGPTTYTVVPKSNVTYNPEAKRTGGGGDDLFKKFKAKKAADRR